MVCLPRRPAFGLFHWNPLLRARDWIEALVPAPAVMLLLAVPVAHGRRRRSRFTPRRHAQQHHHNRALVTATITDDHNGTLTDEPIPTSDAGLDAVTAALAMWAGVAAVAAILLAGTQA